MKGQSPYTLKYNMRYVIDADPGIDDAMAIIMALEEHRRGNIQVIFNSNYNTAIPIHFLKFLQNEFELNCLFLAEIPRPSSLNLSRLKPLKVITGRKIFDPNSFYVIIVLALEAIYVLFHDKLS